MTALAIGSRTSTSPCRGNSCHFHRQARTVLASRCIAFCLPRLSGIPKPYPTSPNRSVIHIQRIKKDIQLPACRYQNAMAANHQPPSSSSFQTLIANGQKDENTNEECLVNSIPPISETEYRYVSKPAHRAPQTHQTALPMMHHSPHFHARPCTIHARNAISAHAR